MHDPVPPRSKDPLLHRSTCAVHYVLIKCLQVSVGGSASTCTERYPMAANATVYTSHWLYTNACSHSVYVSNLIGKPINIGLSAPRESAAGIALDSTHLLYETAWQAASTHVAANATDSCAILLAQPLHAEFVFSQLASQVGQPVLPSAARLTADLSQAAGTAAVSCAAHTILLQTAAAQAPPGSMLQLLTYAGQPAARSSAGCHASMAASAPALGMQSMMRVAAKEFATVQWRSADVGALYPKSKAR